MMKMLNYVKWNSCKKELEGVYNTRMKMKVARSNLVKKENEYSYL